MPTVGGKHFSYSASGKRAAQKYAKSTGQKVAGNKKKKKKGGY
jgi:hypothetical protein